MDDYEDNEDRYLDQEERIVWIEEGAQHLDYVRQSVDWYAKRRRGPMSFKGHEGRLVGYVDLKADAAHRGLNGKFARRYFWLKDHDRDSQPQGTYKVSAPMEAVDPSTVGPGTKGSVTDRAWGAPLPSSLLK